jgi:hypothetical protein
MKHFKFKFYIRTQQKQEFLVAVKGIDAPDYDTANKQLRQYEKHIPFHHFATVEVVK